MTALALALVFAVAGAPPPPRYDPEAVTALAAMEEAATRVQDYTLRLVKRELFGTELSAPETIDIKWQRPQRIYLHEIAGPKAGEEIIYVPGKNKNRIKVRKLINMNLNPYGEVAMAKTHHAVPEISLVRLVNVVMDNMRRARAKNAVRLTFVGPETLFGRNTVRLEATFPPTGKTPSIEKEETLWDISKATGQSMYVILHANRARKWRQAHHPERGDSVIVPDYYAGRMILWIDEELKLPLQVEFYDHEGSLYEHYEHHDLAVNVGLTPADFEPWNPGYGF